ncbi:MAG: cytochrome b562 [Opitutaceae bacterium]|nr:cytochrome b562 [Opitutaceae bacterium]
MKIRLLLLTLIGALVVAPFSFGADEPETELETKMDKIGSAFRTLRRQISDPAKNQDSLAKLAVIRENAQASAKLEPAKTAEVPAAQQQKFVADFQAKMKEFIGLVDKVIAAVKANNNEEATKLVGVMADTQKKAHGDFQKKKKKSS